MNDQKLKKLCEKYAVPEELLLRLLQSEKDLNTSGRKVGHKVALEEIIFNFIKKKNDNK